MADQPSHAATGDRKSFSVEIVSGPDAGRVLASGLSEFHDAIDQAIDWLDAEDAAGRERPSVAVFAADRTAVWSYPPVRTTEVDADEKPLVALYGFDPVAWKPTTFGDAPARLLRAVEPRELPPPIPAATLAAVVDDEEVEEDATPATVTAPRAALARVGDLHRELVALWEDRPARIALVVAAIALWLAVTLLEPAFVAPLLAAGAAVHVRRRHGAVAPAIDVDDWF